MKHIYCLLFLLLLFLPRMTLAQDNFDDVTTLQAPDGTPVVIYRDSYGVPHIHAATEAGAFYGQGFAAASDRLFQMELFRRTSLGRLAELQPDQLIVDQQVRATFYTETERRQLYEALSQPVRVMFDSYTEGINQYLEWIAADPERYKPLEFYQIPEPEPWSVTDVIAVTQFFLRRFGQYGGEELARLQELMAQGPAWFDENRPINDPNAPSTIHGARSTRKVRRPSTFPSVKPEAIDEVFKRQKSVEREMNRMGLPPGIGSIAVIISGRRTKTGNVMLLGAPQLGVHPRMNEVSRAYEVELYAPTLHVAGMAMAGLPGVLVGRNEHLAWTLTSGNSDNTDTYVEITRDESLSQYFYQGAWHDFEVIPEIIHVLGSDDVQFARYRTVHGPVIGHRLQDRQAFTWKMTFWKEELAAAQCFYDMMKATNVRQFESAASRLPTSHNILYVDKYQEVRFWHLGKYPVRVENVDPRLPQVGDGSQEWQGFLAFEELPRASGSDQDYFVNWNNKPAPWWNNGDNIPWSVAFNPERTLRVLKVDAAINPVTRVTYDDLKSVPEKIDTTGTYQLAVEIAKKGFVHFQTILPPGESGFRSLLGFSPHITDQWPLHEQFEFKQMPFYETVVLWPPDHKFHAVNVGKYVDPTLRKTASVATVWSDEASDGPGKKNQKDIKIQDCQTVLLKSERNGGKNGRVYTVHVKAPGPLGAINSAALIEVVVPINASPHGFAIDDGPAYAIDKSGCTDTMPVRKPHVKRKKGAASLKMVQNRPNPFNPSTTISFELSEVSYVRLVVYDVLGREVAVLVDGELASGVHEVPWNAGNLPSGLYLYRISTGQVSETRRMLLLK